MLCSGVWCCSRRSSRRSSSSRRNSSSEGCEEEEEDEVHCRRKSEKMEGKKKKKKKVHCNSDFCEMYSSFFIAHSRFRTSIHSHSSFSITHKQTQNMHTNKLTHTHINITSSRQHSSQNPHMQYTHNSAARRKLCLIEL